MYGISIDREKLKELLEDFYNLTNIRIAFCSYEFKEFMILKKEMSGFCNELRQDSDADKCCRVCDKKAFETALNTRSLYLYECHAGLTEAVAPIFIDDILLGFLMFGQTLSRVPDMDLWHKVGKSCSGFSIDYIKLEEEFFKLSHMDWNKIKAAARIMDRSAKYICYSNMVKLQQPNLVQKITDYIDGNLDKQLSISILSSRLKMSKSYLSSKIKAHYGTSLNGLIIRKRMQKAKKLLELSELKINEISKMAGYLDPNYFSRLFKKKEGISPEEYRTNFKNK